MANPTPAQLQAFANLHIQSPETAAACAALLNWVDAGGDRKQQRIDVIREATQKYVGKKVRRLTGEAIGTVIYVTFRGVASRTAMRALSGQRYTHPLDIMVQWPDRKTATSIESVVVVDG